MSPSIIEPFYFDDHEFLEIETTEPTKSHVGEASRALSDFLSSGINELHVDIPMEVTVVADEKEEEEEASDSEDNEEEAKKQQPKAPAHELFLPVDSDPSYDELAFSDDAPPANTTMFTRFFQPRKVVPTIQHPPISKRIKRTGSFSSQSTGSTGSCSSSSSARSAGVTFNEKVTVFPVFTADVYPHDMRSSIWSSGSEVAANKRRNKIEYRYDNRDWRNATEEDGMILDVVSNELVHPVHYER